jgi:hypothetical protein
LAAAVAMTTNGEIKEVDMPLVIVAAIMCAFPRACPAWSSRLRTAVLAAIILGSFYMGYSRYRVANIGEHRFHEWDLPRQNEPLPFFEGIQASPTLERTIRQAQVAAQGSVFYGSRLEWMYAATGRPSPEGLPVWWNPAAAFPETLTEHFEHAWIDKRFDTLIFCRWDAPFYGPEFGEIILRDYTLDNRYSELTVFRRKKPKPLKQGEPLWQ